MASQNNPYRVKEDTYLALYLSSLRNSETPVSYDFWSGLWVLSSCLGRDVYVDRPGAIVRMNLFVVLIGESGRLRKSTAIGFADKLLQKAIDLQHVHIQAKTTSERIMDLLEQQSNVLGYCNLFLSASELVSIVGRERYLQNMPSMLVDLYDCPDKRMSGFGTILNNYTTFLAASAQSWLARSINPEIVSGGFTSRTLFIVEQDPKKVVPWPRREESELEVLSNRLNRLVKRARQVKSIDLQPSAMSYYTKWYVSRKQSNDVFRSNFEGREDSHVLRLAALLSINDELYKIERRHIKQAIQLVYTAKLSGYSLFSITTPQDRIQRGADQLRRFFTSKGLNWSTKTEVYKVVKIFMNAKILNTILNALLEQDYIQQASSRGKGRPVTVLRATKKILNNDYFTIIQNAIKTSEEALQDHDFET